MLRLSRKGHCCVIVGIVVCLTSLSGSAQDRKNDVTLEEAVQLGVEAYIYGYPLVTMEMTRRVMTNVESADALRGPMGQFVNAREYPSADFRDVTAFNADTLYSCAWLDVAKEPYILSLPDQDGRYFLMPILSGWTDVLDAPGTRTTGNKAQKCAITGPGWKGTLPDGVTECKSPTSMVWIIGRTYCTATPTDYQVVHSIQDRYSLVPLGAYGKNYVPPKGKVDPTVDMKTPVRDQVNRLDVVTYFKMLSLLMKDNPPAKADAPIVEMLAKIGIVPGQDFDINTFNPLVATALKAVPVAAQLKIVAHIKKAGTLINGWTYTDKAGNYGADYLQRAFIAAVGLGANRPQDAVYPTSQVDGEGNVYNGTNKYVMHFPKGQTPPVKGFWSLTMYNGDLFFVSNPLNRYAVGSHCDFKYDDDGSLNLLIQKDSPGKDRESNWLPAPDGKFILMLRLYWPRETAPSILDGSWRPPAVQKVK